MPKGEKKISVVVILILVLALALRLISIDQSLWLDEATSASVANYSLEQFFSEFSPNDFHPPFYYLSLMAWSKVFGVSEIGVRSLSIFAGLVVVWVSYLIGKSIASLRTGLIAALFTATSGLLVYYSQEARMYMLAAMLASLAIYFFLEKKWFGFSLALAFGFLTHYVMVFMLPVFWVYGLITHRSGGWWKRFIVYHIPLILVVFAWLPVFRKQFTAGLEVESVSPLWWNILGRTTPKEILLIPAKFIFGRISVSNDLIYVTLVFVVGIVYLVIMQTKRPCKVRPCKVVNDKLFLVWLWLIVPTVLAMIFGLRIPVFSYFRLLFVVPALFIILAIGLDSLKKNYMMFGVAFVLLVNLVSTSTYLSNPKFQREDWQGLVRYVTANSPSKSTVLFVKDSQMEVYNYYSQTECEGFFVICSNSPKAVSPDNLSAGNDTIWLMRYVQPVFDSEDKVRAKVEEMGYIKASEHDFNGIVVWEYGK